MTRTEVIAQIEAEISLLERARDILAAPLADFIHISPRKPKTRLSPTKQVEPAAVAASVAAQIAVAAVAAPVAVQPNPEPQVQRVPPKRRMERRHMEKPGKSPAALGGFVPAGPIVVSADEARKLQERNVAPPPMPMVSEIRPEIGSERSLASLIQAFERRTGLGGIETPRS
jgi:hypothetical protein